MTCRKTRAWLSENGFHVSERDFFKHPLTVIEITGMLSAKDPADYFSFLSPTFKATGLKKEDLTGSDLIKMMAGEPRYIRRPIVIFDGIPIPGASIKVLENRWNLLN
jgi:arsenate reductase-like glutaredoxin family protein